MRYNIIVKNKKRKKYFYNAVFIVLIARNTRIVLSPLYANVVSSEQSEYGAWEEKTI